MGQGGSKQQQQQPEQPPAETKGNSICVDCDKKTQKELPSDDASSSSGQPCALFYKKVSECMKVHEGLIAPCSKEWDAFQKCHKERKPVHSK
jgi:hypothetical protein